MHASHSSWIENLTWSQVEQRINAGAIAILPVGAASKEHGRHLPMNTDYRQAEWLASQLASRLDVLVWPIINYGYYPSFVDYPGSISIAEDTFRCTIEAVISGICFSGVSRVLILNTGISTIRPLQRAVENVGASADVYLHNVYSGHVFSRTEQSLSEQQFGGHADEIETSIMLALDESVVDLNLASAQPVKISKGLFNRTEPDQLNFSPDGINGDATLASREKGEKLLAALLTDCLEAMSKTFALGSAD